MSQIAIVEMIYVAKSGRQYRAQHVEARVGWELDDLASKAKSDLSLKDYAIQFTNVNGHQQVVMPGDLETIIVNVLGVREERWEEPAYEAMKQGWEETFDLRFKLPDGSEAIAEHKLAEPTPAPKRHDLTKLHRRNPVAPVVPDGEVTQSIKITWGAKPKPPEQRVQWGAKRPEAAEEATQPITVLKASEVAGMSMDEATQIVEAVAAGGSVSAATH
jgi:hypothetical protein